MKIRKEEANHIVTGHHINWELIEAKAINDQIHESIFKCLSDGKYYKFKYSIGEEEVFKSDIIPVEVIKNEEAWVPAA